MSYEGYEDLEDGMILEFEDFHYSNILSWRAGTVKIDDGFKSLNYSDKEGVVLFPHRMDRLRKSLKPKEEK